MKDVSAVNSELVALAGKVKGASRRVRLASAQQKNDALGYMAEGLEHTIDEILTANADDVARARGEGMPSGQVDRLALTESRVKEMAAQVLEVAALADPVGQVTRGYRLPNGLAVSRERVPLGVVGIIYENRPNVTSDAAALCLKSGNAAFLRGSSAAFSSNRAIASVLSEALVKAGLPRDAVALVPDASRESAVAFMRLRGYVDCLIPRGGRSLIAAIEEHATVPYIIDGEGNCHIFVDASANLDAAEKIVRNAKVQRPSVCNAVETVLVHRDVAGEFLARMDTFLAEVEIRGDETTCAAIPRAIAATDEDWATEYLDLKLAVRVVDDLEQAVDHISRYGTGHSEAILTNDYANASRFTREVDAAAVLVNASTRFVDGNQLGLGAEIGISTQKLHARGPMGLEALTTERYVIEGSGQVRG
ncbi:MAG: glutamate-5-semialdehyde dehydrogenase [Actinomycetota bacterium]|nr:glutamate-5-semialdehyde dehydrogenase [Actinomycetota bacterium]